ncbi:MAG: L,D-transpeptidase family protein [Proteobacteria bacterium]|nr:L,D-transpeptidase family protein [Pseudomonadota bacterium]MBU1639021.1 L,D-transpeptidase family protein [Pseudomonadota bacterium]
MPLRQTLIVVLFFISFRGLLLGAAEPCLAAEWPLAQASGPPAIIGTLQDYTIKDDRQTLVDLARQYDLGYNEITDANPEVDPWYPEAGTEVLLPTAWILPASLPASTRTLGETYIIQTGSFTDLAGARGQWQDLAGLLPADLAASLRIERIQQYYVVRCGLFAEKRAAEQAQKRVEGLVPGTLVFESGISQGRLLAGFGAGLATPLMVGMVVNLAEMRLYYREWRGGGSVDRTFPVGVGRPGSETKPGQYRVIGKAQDPPWLVPKEIRAARPELPAVVPPGPDNPLGRFALRLSQFDYIIHGTNKAPGIGRRVSNGCIRMYPEDIEKVYAMVPVGCAVQITYETVKIGVRQGIAHIEVHPDYLQISNQLEVAIALLKEHDLFAHIDLGLLRQALKECRGIPVPLHKH